MASRPAGRGRLVLDTHVWIRAVEGLTAKLGGTTVTATIATARRYGTLLTCDESVLAWGQAHKHVRVLDGRP
jgi:hypothetical protein